MSGESGAHSRNARPARQVADSIFVRRQSRRTPAGLQAVGRSPVEEPRQLEVPGEPWGQRIEIVRRLPAQRLQCAADCLMQVYPPHDVQVIVEVTLEKVMPETIT